MAKIILDITDEQLATVKQQVEQYDDHVVVKDPLKLLETILKDELNDMEWYIGSHIMDEGGNDLFGCFDADKPGDLPRELKDCVEEIEGPVR